MLELILVSLVAVNIYIIVKYISSHKEYQWRLVGISLYTIFGGMLGFIVACAGVEIWVSTYEVRDGGLVIFGFGPLLILVGELTGFWLYTRSAARERRRIQGEA